MPNATGPVKLLPCPYMTRRHSKATMVAVPETGAIALPFEEAFPFEQLPEELQVS